MKRLKVMTILGTRPEIIRLSEVIKKCDSYFEHILVHTGQNYDYTLNQVFFEELGLRKPDYYLNAAGKNLGETIGTIISKSYDLMVEHSPDALLILGDTNSALSSISAKRLKIPIFHMEAGNRCFDENLPEETNRRIVDHISDVNMCYSEHARRYLNSEGTAKERTFVIGSPMPEVLAKNWDNILSSNILQKLALKKDGYILLSAHREENIDSTEHFYSLMNAINEMAEYYALPVIYSMHPRSRKFIQERTFQFSKLVTSMEPFGFFAYNYLQMNARCVVSDSGTLPEESSFFCTKGYPFASVCIRTSTERPEAIETGNFILGNITADSIIQSVDMAIQMNKQKQKPSLVRDYADENVSTKVVKLIQSYVSVINEMVWRK
ncbi:MAG: non-hydrolyzing UDP-N-acetylglucosamine 2-epimerase [Lacrimispora sphenoides]